MKFLAPILALALVAAGLGMQRRTITTVEREVVTLRERVRAARGGGNDDPSLASHVRRKPAGTADQAVDWNQVAERMLAERDGGGRDMRTNIALQRRIMAMTAEQLHAALDEIAALEVPDEVRSQLEAMLVDALARQDPRGALERFGDRVGEARTAMNWQLSQALRRWAGEEPAAAAAWLDRQVAAGLFDSRSLDGRSHSRFLFEAAVVGVLLADDPAAAGRRIAALPEDQRAEVLRQRMFITPGPETEQAFAALVREQVPEDERARTLLSTLTNRSANQEARRELDDYLDRIEATTGERRDIAQEVAGWALNARAGEGLDRGDVDELREWLVAQAPDDADRITGQALGRLGDPSVKFGDTVAMVAELHAETGSDALLAAFLEGHRAKAEPELAMPLVEKISDESLRDTLRRQLEEAAARRDARTPAP